jgi:hypothetical protein
MEFTGERYVPNYEIPESSCEHWHCNDKDTGDGPEQQGGTPDGSGNGNREDFDAELPRLV